MKILYLARHDQMNSSDDEGAIAHALELLGHTVIKIHESHGRRVVLKVKADLCLFHKFSEVDTLVRLKMPKVFYYFDLVQYPDETLEPRNRNRRDWMARVIPHVNLGFLTDGDWVAKDTSGKLVWLNQGVDVRVTGPGASPTMPRGQEPLLFTGIVKGAGEERNKFVQTIKKEWPSIRCVERGLYQRNLADAIASTQIVLAPSGPATDHYWSNRVYNVLGFQGFLLHPYCAGLAKQYLDGHDLLFYQNHDDLHDKIEWYLERPEACQKIARAGYIRTMAAHTYVHRCSRLLEIVKERLGDPAHS